jgi:hypothetical protein
MRGFWPVLIPPKPAYGKGGVYVRVVQNANGHFFLMAARSRSLAI